MDIAAQLHDALKGGTLLAFPLSLIGGLIAGFNPCCLALYPAAAAACCTGTACSPRRSFLHALAFLLGMALALSLLGLAAGIVGRITGPGIVWRYLIAVIPITMGLNLLGWISLPLARLAKFTARGGGAFGTGFALSLVIGPCGTPLLAAVLSYAAYKGGLIYGALLLFLYGIGAGTPMLLVGVFAGHITQKMELAGLKHWVDGAAGVFLILLGFYLLWIA